MKKDTFLSIIQQRSCMRDDFHETWERALTIPENDPRWRSISSDDIEASGELYIFNKTFGFSIPAQSPAKPRAKKSEMLAQKLEKYRGMRPSIKPENLEAFDRNFVEVEIQLAKAVKIESEER